MVDTVICFLNLSYYTTTGRYRDKRCIPKHSLWLPGKGHLRTDSSVASWGISLVQKNEYRRDGISGYGAVGKEMIGTAC